MNKQEKRLLGGRAHEALIFLQENRLYPGLANMMPPLSGQTAAKGFQVMVSV